MNDVYVGNKVVATNDDVTLLVDNQPLPAIILVNVNLLVGIILPNGLVADIDYYKK